MSKSKKLFGAVAFAGILAASGTAFTAANTGVDDAISGYDSAAISGVTVTNVAYNVDATDASKLSSIVFTENQDVSTGHDAILTVNGPSGVTQITCTPTFTADPDPLVVTNEGTITCTTSQDIALVNNISLTVSAN